MNMNCVEYMRARADMNSARFLRSSSSDPHPIVSPLLYSGISPSYQHSLSSDHGVSLNIDAPLEFIYGIYEHTALR